MHCMSNTSKGVIIITRYNAAYPHALHARHGSERPERSQCPHGSEGLDAPRPQQRGSEVD